MSTCKDCGYWHQADHHLKTGFGHCYATPSKRGITGEDAHCDHFTTQTDPPDPICRNCGYWSTTATDSDIGECHRKIPYEGIQRQRQGDSCKQFRDRAQLPPPTFYEEPRFTGPERQQNELRRLLQERCNMQDEIDRLLDRRAQLEHVHLVDLDRIDHLRAMCEHFATTILKMEKKVADLEDETIRLNDQNNEWFSSYKHFVTTISKMEKKVADLEDETIRLNDQNNKWFSSYEQAKGERDTNRAQLEEARIERDRARAAHQEATEIIARQDAKIDELQPTV